MIGFFQFILIKQYQNVPIRIFTSISSSLRPKKNHLSTSWHNLRYCLLNGMQYVFFTI